tara:strand:+ start:129 stop:527 length:399 start_codon:yes stop_codon:yes gene_type:complete
MADEQIDNLLFENQQLHCYTDHLETRLRNIKSFIRQGITYHKKVAKLTGTEEAKKHLEFLNDAMSILQDEIIQDSVPMAKEVSPLKLPPLKSMKDLNRKPSPRRVNVLREEARLSPQDFDLQYNLSNKKYRK